MNCKKYQEEIDRSGATNLSAETLQHVAGCSDCNRLNREQERLQQLLSTLETVNAPTDFNFRLKARLQMRTANKSAMRKLLWIAPTTAAAVLCGFVLTRSSFDQTTLQADANAVQQQSIVAAQPTSTNSTTDQDALLNAAASDKNLPTVAPPREVARNIEPKLSPSGNNRVVNAASSAQRKNKVQSEKEVVQSRMSSLRNQKNSILPPGIPDPLDAPGKLDAKQLLRTLGVETIEQTNGLQVVSVSEQARRSGLQKADVIEKVNGEDLNALPNVLPQEMKLLIRRQTETQTITISPKP